MPTVPKRPRAIAFVDGQNLFHAAKAAYGHSFPNYDIRVLATETCRRHDWEMSAVRFYSGMHSLQHHPRLHAFWNGKLCQMKRDGVWCFTPTVRYQLRIVYDRDGRPETRLVGTEKGIDVRIALDIVRMAHKCEYDVALIFSQDQDLAEAAKELRQIAREQQRWIKAASAFPASNLYRNARGINGTDWIRISRSQYDSCLDQTNYWPLPR